MEAHDYSDLHDLVDRLPPAKARHLRLLVAADPELSPFVDSTAPRRFRTLRSFDGPSEPLGAKTREIIRAEIGEGDVDR